MLVVSRSNLIDELSSCLLLQSTSGKHASKFSPTGFARAGVSHDDKLLVPVDGSDNAMRALEYTIRLAKDYGPIELVIVDAHEPISSMASFHSRAGREVKELQRKHGEDILRRYIETAKRAGVTSASQVLIGDIPKSIVSCAETLGCDGIVMGTRGISAIGNLVAGFVATKVIDLTKLLVMLAK